MNKRIYTLLTLTTLCLATLISGCGKEPTEVFVVSQCMINAEVIETTKPVSLRLIDDFRKNLQLGIGATIVSAKEVGIIKNFGRWFVVFDAIVDVRGQHFPSKVLRKTYSITHGKNSDGPFVNTPQPGENILVILINDTYYGPIEYLNL